MESVQKRVKRKKLREKNWGTLTKVAEKRVLKGNKKVFTKEAKTKRKSRRLSH